MLTWDIKRLNLTVLGVVCVFVFEYWTTVSCVIIPWFSYSVPGVLNIFFFTFTTFSALMFYILCVVIDPGRVPQDYDPELMTDKTGIDQVKRKTGGSRYCQKCHFAKPPRTHHCRVCQRCVLRMDHHCPWTNNCIGHKNYKAFLLFLLYVNAALIHAVGLLALHTMHVLGSYKAASGDKSGTAKVKNPAVLAVLQTFCLGIGIPLELGLAMLLGWHLYLVFYNKTTIEYHEGVAGRIKASRSGLKYQHPYDLGFCGNLHGIFGIHANHWCLPGCSLDGDGTWYPTAADQLLDQYPANNKDIEKGNAVS